MISTKPLRRVGAIAFAVCLTIAGTPQPAAAAPVVDTVEPFINYLTYLGAVPRAMAVLNGSTANLTPLVQFTHTAAPPDNDVMVLEKETAPNQYRIKPLHTYSKDGDRSADKCLAVRDLKGDDNIPIVNATCTYDSINNDVWRINVIHDPNRDFLRIVEFINQRSGACLVTQGASTANGARLITADCNGTENSRWVINLSG